MRKLQSGIGLVEILIAVAMLGGLALLISNLNQNANKVAANLEVNSDLLQTMQEIQQILVNPENCTMTFQGKNAVNSTNAVQTIKQKYNTTFLDVYPTSTFNPQKVYGSKRLKINSYTISDAANEVDASTYGTTHLVINFNRGKSGSQTELITKRITLNVKIDGAGNITSCGAATVKKNDIWKYSSNNTDIYFDAGAVGMGINSPTHNLTIQARTLPGITSGISILGNESTTAGWNRSSIMFSDQSSAQFWALSMFGVASSEGEGTFGIGGGPTGTTGMNRFIITKEGNVGVNTNLIDPTCGHSACSSATRFLHVHSNTVGNVDASQLVLTNEAVAENSLVGGVAFAASKSAGPDRRVGVITGHIASAPGATLRGNLLLWTNNNGANAIRGNLSPEGNFSVTGSTVTTKLNTPSDRRLKKNIRDLDNSLNKILRLRGVSYDWKDRNHPGTSLGFIAQEVEEIYPEIVKTDNEKKSLSYIGLVAPVIEAIKTLVLMDMDQRKEMLALEKENKLIKDHICRREKASFCY